MITMTDDRQDATTMAPTFEEAIAFIWAEADLLDRLDYKKWLPLWTEGGATSFRPSGMPRISMTASTS